jgi:hypothetical protein
VSAAITGEYCVLYWKDCASYINCTCGLGILRAISVTGGMVLPVDAIIYLSFEAHVIHVVAQIDSSSQYSFISVMHAGCSEILLVDNQNQCNTHLYVGIFCCALNDCMLTSYFVFVICLFVQICICAMRANGGCGCNLRHMAGWG